MTYILNLRIINIKINNTWRYFSLRALCTNCGTVSQHQSSDTQVNGNGDWPIR